MANSPSVYLILILLASSILFTSVLTEDKCDDVSYAKVAVEALAPSLTTPTYSVTEGISKLWEVSHKLSTPHQVNVFFGTSNNDFWMIKYCKSVANLNNEYCVKSGSKYVAYVRHTTLNERRQIFSLNEDGTLGNALGNETSIYSTTTRDWYVKSNGWTNRYNFASGGSGKSYVMAFTGGVAAADRDYREPCDACLMNSYTVISSMLLASVSDLKKYSNVTSSTGLNAAANTILSIIDKVRRGRGFIVNVFMGHSNSDFYMVKDCESIANESNNKCKEAKEKNSRYIIYVRNEKLYSDKRMRLLTIQRSGDSVTTEMLSTDENFETTQRPWYQVGDGFSDEYTFAEDANLKGRAYSVSFDGGVAASDYITSEPCDSCGTIRNQASQYNQVQSGIILLSCLVLSLLMVSVMYG